MKFVEVKRNIRTSPESIWTILTSAKTLQSNDLGITRIDGSIALSNKLKLWSEVSPGRAFSLKVTEFVENRRMVWTGGMPFGLFTGNRTYALTPLSETTELHIREEFTGPLSGLIWKSMPDLDPSFEKLADGIKALAEGNAR